MKEQHELDRLLKSKFDAREFEFREAYWEEAEGLIAAAEAVGKKPWGFWWRWLVADSALVVTLLAAMFIFTPSTFESESSLLAKNNQSSTATPKHNITLQAKHTSPFSTLTKSNSPDKHLPSTSHIVEKSDEASFSTEASQNKENTIASAQEINQPLSSLLNRSLDSLASLLHPVQVEGAFPDERIIPDAQDIQKIKKHHIGIVAGVQTSTSFGTADVQQLSHWPTIGLKYSYALNSRLHLQSGLMIENRSALSLSKAFTSTQYSFGRNEETTILQAQSLHSIGLPLQVGYRFHKRHSITTGLNISYLLNVRSSLTTQSTDAFGAVKESKEQAWGYRQGLQRWDAGILLGYKFQFMPRLGLMIEAYQGFRDISDDTFWEVTRVDKQRQLRVKLHWNIH